MTTETLTLSQFLLERIADDERWVDADTHGALRDLRARVLATCKAHRAIVEAHPVSTEYEAEYCMTCQWDVDCDAPKHDHQNGAGEYPCPTLRALASIYADHPSFDPRWAL